MVDTRDERLGTIELIPFPDAVVAGSMAQWTLVYTAGRYGIDEGGTLMLVQRAACDWQIPRWFNGFHLRQFSRLSRENESVWSVLCRANWLLGNQ